MTKPILIIRCSDSFKEDIIAFSKERLEQGYYVLILDSPEYVDIEFEYPKNHCFAIQDTMVKIEDIKNSFSKVENDKATF